MLIANIKKNFNYTGEKLAKLERSLGLVQQTLNSKAFTDAVMGFGPFHFTVKPCWQIWRRSYEAPHHTNAEVLSKVLGGKQRNGADTLMELQVRLLPGSGGNVVGETSNGIIGTYAGDLNSRNDERLAAHLAHEYTHTIGFKHTSGTCDDKRDCYSVPYAVGNLVELLLTGRLEYARCPYESAFK
ncbi:MAG: hypothetical protein IPN62_02515 [Flavobacteriales bacterium]|nr:hypothetical protein [Flavobacteriales bacterium]